MSKNKVEKIYKKWENTEELLNNLPGMTYCCRYDKDWTMLYVSGGCLELTGYPSESLLFNREISFNQLIDEAYQDLLWKKWEKVVNSHGRFKEEYQIVTASGENKWVWEQGHAVYNEKGEVVALEGIIFDINEQKLNELRLQYLSENNPVTNLPNRVCLESDYQKICRKEKQQEITLFMVTVRWFRYLNNLFGFREVEEILKEVAEKLRGFQQKDIKLYHTDMDQYVFLFLKRNEKKEILQFFYAVKNVLKKNIRDKYIYFDVGILQMDNLCCSEMDQILKSASIAASNANQKERCAFSFYDTKMEKQLEREQIIRDYIEKIIETEDHPGLFMNYQPIVNVKTGEISGFEALARLYIPELGNVSPLEFISVAEKARQMVPLGNRILERVFGFAKELFQYKKEMTLSFNVSLFQLLNHSFTKFLKEQLKKTKINPSQLNAELTESVFSDNFSEVKTMVDKIKKLGIRVSIDDFGTGYSSLAREQELEADFLKIDKYFMDELRENKEKKSVAEDIISMAHKLGNYVVAEGVEEKEQLEYLKKHNCDYYQGYFFSKPVSQGAVYTLLE